MANRFQTVMKGLLDTGQLGDLGTGLLAQSGYSATPITFGQAFGNAGQHMNERQKERMQMEFARKELEEKAAKREAMEQLSSMLGGDPGTVPTTPASAAPTEGRQQLLSLLSTAYPEQFGQYAMAQAFPQQQEKPRVSTELNDFAALNPELKVGTPEFRTEFAKWATQNDLPDNLRQQLEVQLLGENLAAARASRQASEGTVQQQEVALRRALVEDGSKLKAMFELNQKLEGSMLESGLPMPEIRRAIAGGISAVQQVFGVNSSQAKMIMERYDTFNKYATDFVVNSLDRMAGTGAISIPKFEALIASNASLGSSPGTNATIIANNIEALLEGAEVEGVTLPNEAELRAILDDYHQQGGNGSDLTPAEMQELEALRKAQGAL